MLSHQTIYQFQHGSQQAFRQLYDHFCKRIYQFAYRYLRNREQAEEIAADQFIKLWLRRANFRTYENIRAFLMTCTRNACLDILRKHSTQEIHRRQWLKQQADIEEPVKIANMIHQENLTAIMEVADCLPAECKKVFQLHFIEERRAAEIARLLNITESTVYNQKARAVARLRQRLGHIKREILS